MRTKKSLFFAGALADPASAFFHYTTDQPNLSRAKMHKFENKKILKFVHLFLSKSIDFFYECDIL